jgi:translocation and assembly module TamB
LSPLRSVLDVQTLSLDAGRFEGRIYGDPGTVRFDATTTLTNLAYEDYRLADVETHVAGTQGDTTALAALEVRGRIGFFSYSTVSVEDATFEGAYSAAEQVRFSSSMTIDRERSARFGGVADLRPGNEQIVLQTVNLRLGPDRWQLLQDASISYGDAYRISNLLLYSNQQQLAADGMVDFDGRQSLVVTLESIEIGSITDLLGFEGLGGRLSGTLAMQGTARSPQINGTLNLGIESFDEEVGQLRLALDYDSLRAGIDAQLTHVDGSTLTMTGQLPANLRLAADTVSVMDDPIDLSLTADAFSIGWIDPFIDPELAQDIHGQFTANAAIGGTLDTPELSGEGTLRNGQLDLTELNTTYGNIAADLDFDGELVRVREATMRSSGGGRLQAQGSISLTDLTLGAYDLAITTTDFLAIDTREYRARLDSDLDVSGTTQRPVVTGTVQVESADIYLTTGSESAADLATVELSETDQQIIERRFGIRLTEADTTTFDTYEAMALDLSVQLERDTWLRSRSNPQMSIQFTGSLDVVKEPSEDAQVFGTIEVIPERSRVVQFGKEFQIEEGTLTFNGDPVEPVLDIQAAYDVRARRSRQEEVSITLAISGRPDDLDLTLGSTPTMDTNNILSYLAVGRPTDRLIGGASGEGTDQSLAERVALGQAASFVENLAASRLGLDVVRIEPTPEGTIFLTAGQYLSPQFYVAIQQSITDEPGAQVTSRVPDITLEYELTRWLLMRALYRNPNLRLNLFWEYAY